MRPRDHRERSFVDIIGGFPTPNHLTIDVVSPERLGAVASGIGAWLQSTGCHEKGLEFLGAAVQCTAPETALALTAAITDVNIRALTVAITPIERKKKGRANRKKKKKKRKKKKKQARRPARSVSPAQAEARDEEEPLLALREVEDAEAGEWVTVRPSTPRKRVKVPREDPVPRDICAAPPVQERETSAAPKQASPPPVLEPKASLAPQQAVATPPLRYWTGVLRPLAGRYVVYGSHALGVALPDSPVDIVIAPESESEFRTLVNITGEHHVRGIGPLFVCSDDKQLAHVSLRSPAHFGPILTSAMQAVFASSPAFRRAFLIARRNLYAQGYHRQVRGGLGSLALFVLLCAVSSRMGVISPPSMSTFLSQFPFQKLSLVMMIELGCLPTIAWVPRQLWGEIEIAVSVFQRGVLLHHDSNVARSLWRTSRHAVFSALLTPPTT